jgi:hypothetical protein
MDRRKKEGVFTLVFEHIRGQILLDAGYIKDDSGSPILKHRLYSVEKNRAFTKIKLNPKASKSGAKRNTGIESKSGTAERKKEVCNS